jgi:hypothetical protein
MVGDQDIVAAVKPYFEVFELKAVRYHHGSDASAEAWRLLARKCRPW